MKTTSHLFWRWKWDRVEESAVLMLFGVCAIAAVNVEMTHALFAEY
jgi:hypothetical protein